MSTDDKTPATEAGLEDALAFHLPAIVAAWDSGETDNVGVARLILKLVRPAIEAEAREQGYETALSPSGYAQGRADALREAAEQVRAMTLAEGYDQRWHDIVSRDAVLAILETER